MKILIRSMGLLVLLTTLIGCPAPETLIRSTVLLVLLTTLIGCIQATPSTPYPYLPTHTSPDEGTLLKTS
jgi:predicted small lipoprotein YifL